MVAMQSAQSSAPLATPCAGSIQGLTKCLDVAAACKGGGGLSPNSYSMGSLSYDSGYETGPFMCLSHFGNCSLGRLPDSELSDCTVGPPTYIPHAKGRPKCTLSLSIDSLLGAPSSLEMVLFICFGPQCRYRWYTGAPP